MKAFRYAAMVAAVMLAVTTSPASACAGGGWRILHLEWLCCWIWGNNHKGCKQPEPGNSPQTSESGMIRATPSCSLASAGVLRS